MDTENIYTEALRLWLSVPQPDLGSASRIGPDAELDGNMLLLGDNLSLMAALSEQIGEGIRAPLGLVYMDPPYFSNRDRISRVKVKTASGEVFMNAPAYSDVWKGSETDDSSESAIEAYLAMLTPRLIAARELLSDSGSLWIHLDRRAVHYAKVMADLVFQDGGALINEVIWTYKSGGSSIKSFANKHDTLLFYAKKKAKHRFFPLEEKSYNRALKPYRFKGVKEFRDEHGWYTIVKMKDVWELPMVGRTARERTGYATQKPELLLERIVLSCTLEGDFCLDPFGGSGTLAAVCKKLGRGWISIDENPMAIDITAKRLGLD